ncbi:hypothetical protein [Streptomyces sp. NPDC059063]|uniref:hypothetical protein n=1 Tax=Streptomyces sp. NPDC059063 TaxID=3346712 RepID=UPI0036CAABF6
MTSHQTADLTRALQALGEHGDRLALFEPSPEQLDEIALDIDEARKLVARARASLGPTGCLQHPGAPAAPGPGSGPGRACLLCEIAQRRGRASMRPVVAPVVPLDVVARTIAEEGQEEAVRRYGGQTVTRALVKCRTDLALTEESA